MNTKKIQALKKGCKADMGFIRLTEKEGRTFYCGEIIGSKWDYKLRKEKLRLCPICQAKLSQATEDKIKFDKKLDDFVAKLKEGISGNYIGYEDTPQAWEQQKKDIFEFIDRLLQKYFKGNSQIDSQQDCKGGQTISDNVSSSRNLLQEKVLAPSETSAYGLQATSERSDYKTGSNMETTGDVRLKSSEVVSLLNDGTPRSSKSPADTLNSQKQESNNENN